MNKTNIVIQSTDGAKFGASVSSGLTFGALASNFFENQEWPTEDSQGRGQRAVIELVDPDDPEHTTRLNSDETLEDMGIEDGAIFRIFPESIAGAVNEKARLRALIDDHNKMKKLAEWDEDITFTTNTSHAPTLYIVTFLYEGFSHLKNDGTPHIIDNHQAEITLVADYPRVAPRVKWLTQIFHPNIAQDSGQVCLGVLMERYLPGLGLARLVTMLSEMVQYRNFDATSPLNKKAMKWAINPDNQRFIKQIGGSVIQDPIEELLKKSKISDHQNNISFQKIKK